MSKYTADLRGYHIWTQNDEKVLRLTDANKIKQEWWGKVGVCIDRSVHENAFIHIHKYCFEWENPEYSKGLLIYVSCNFILM